MGLKYIKQKLLEKYRKFTKITTLEGYFSTTLLTLNRWSRLRRWNKQTGKYVSEDGGDFFEKNN